MRVSRLALAALAVSLLAAPPAWACWVPPPPPQESNESDAAYRARIEERAQIERVDWQRRSWEQASSAALVRIDRLRPRPTELYPDYKSAFVSVVRWLKGGPGKIDFEFRRLGACFAEDTVASGAVGDTYLVLFAGDQPRRSALLAAWRPDPADFAPIKALLDAAE